MWKRHAVTDTDIMSSGQNCQPRFWKLGSVIVISEPAQSQKSRMQRILICVNFLYYPFIIYSLDYIIKVQNSRCDYFLYYNYIQYVDIKYAQLINAAFMHHHLLVVQRQM